METLIIYLFFVIAVVVDSLEDSYIVKWRYSNLKTTDHLNFMRHAVQSFHILIWLLLVLWIGIFTPFHKANNLNDILYIIVMFIGSYSLVRFSIFDYLFNIFTDQSPFHIGKYSVYDKILGVIVWIFKKSEMFAHWIIFILKFTALISAYQLLKLIII